MTRLTISREAIASGLKRLSQQLLTAKGPLAQATMVTAPLLDGELRETGKTIQIHVSYQVAVVGRASAALQVPKEPSQPAAEG